MRLIVTLLLVSLIAAGCCNLPIKDGELVIGKDTTASIEDVGVGRVSRDF